MIKNEILFIARKQIGLHFRKLRTDRQIGTKTLSEKSGLTEAQIIDMELNRRNYTIDSLLRYIHAMDMYFFLSEKEGHHLDFDHMLTKSDPDQSAL